MNKEIKKVCPVCDSRNKSNDLFQLNALVCNVCGYEFLLTDIVQYKDLIKESIYIQKRNSDSYILLKKENESISKELDEKTSSLNTLKNNYDKFQRILSGVDIIGIKKDYEALMGKKNELESILNENIVDDNIAQVYFIDSDTTRNCILITTNARINQSWQLAIIYSNKAIVDYRNADVIEIVNVPFANLNPKVGNELVYLFEHVFIQGYKHIYFRQYIKK